MRRLLGLALLLSCAAILEVREARADDGLTRRPLPTSEVASSAPCCRSELYRRWGLDDDSWLRVELPVWIPGITGTMAQGSSTVSSDTSLGDRLGDLGDTVTGFQFALVGRVVAARGRWSVLVDAFGASLDGRWQVTSRDRLRTDGTLKALILRSDVAYRVLDCPVAIGPRWTRLRADAYAGARYYVASLEIDRILRFETGIDARDDWVDPIVGVRADWDLSRRFGVRVETDVGGFGLGSDFAWWISAAVEYRFTWHLSVGLGYTNLRFLRDLTDEGGRLDWNLRLSGPTLSIGLRL